jgi:predicted Zn-dependent protease
MKHEFGHLMGLVDQGSPMQNDHKDADHGAHCINPSCLMYHAVETTGIDGTNTIPELDAQCAVDLKANGGK